ncbi:MAG: UDP-N-acetylglucosamine--N-acetylmuramyl-(pentapeptide) pyrophosphoryl-undecaprenol N-acetylglucosamine transferase, partial [Rikenellaceae bacterium]
MKKIILSGGGTGGHIYPAVAVAEELIRRYRDDIEILFVGAEGRMEMEKVPALGYKITSLPIAGIQRRFDWHNIEVPFKLLKSITRAKRIIKEFNADVVVGFGGYASAPILWAAQHSGVPTIIQEQNSFAGLTNKILGRRAKRVCVAYDNMERFFAHDKIVHTGNPLRGDFTKARLMRDEARKHFNFDAQRPVVLVVGGSLGTRTLNEMMKSYILSLNGAASPMQVIWQTGKFYQKEMVKFLEEHPTQGIWQGSR